VRKHSLGLPCVDCGFLLFCIHVGGGGALDFLTIDGVDMDIIGTDLAAGILFTFQSLILVELGLKLSFKSAFVLCIFHELLVRKKANENGVTLLLHSRCEANFFMWSFL
jgi:hypothetical protein